MLARALGITAEEVEQAKEDGTLKDLLADVSRDDLRTAYQDEATEAIDDASAAGAITSTQANRLKDSVTADRSELTDSEIETLKSLRGTVTVDVTAVYASVLGITSAEVEAAKEDGTLRDLLGGGEPRRTRRPRSSTRATRRSTPPRRRATSRPSRRTLLRDAGKGFGGYRGHRAAAGMASAGGHGCDRRRLPGPRRLGRRRQEGCDGHRQGRVRLGSNFPASDAAESREGAPPGRPFCLSCVVPQLRLSRPWTPRSRAACPRGTKTSGSTTSMNTKTCPSGRWSPAAQLDLHPVPVEEQRQRQSRG